MGSNVFGDNLGVFTQICTMVIIIIIKKHYTALKTAINLNCRYHNSAHIAKNHTLVISLCKADSLLDSTGHIPVPSMCDAASKQPRIPLGAFQKQSVRPA